MLGRGGGLQGCVTGKGMAFGLAVLNSEYSFTHPCLKHGQNLSLIGCGITSGETLTGHYKLINQHQIIFWTRLLLLVVSFNLNNLELMIEGLLFS